MKWSRPAKLPEIKGNPRDPYLAWAAATGFRSYGGDGEHVGVIARLAPDRTLKQLMAERPDGVSGRWIAVAPIYEGGARSDRQQPLTVFTATLRREYLEHLQESKVVQRFELGLPVVPPRLARQRAAASTPHVVSKIERHAVPPHGSPGVIGIIDYGCAFLHANFRTGNKRSGRSRMFSLWDQNVGAARHGFGPPPGFGYGRELSSKQIDAALNLLDKNPAMDGEEKLYRAMGFLLDGRSAPSTTKVMPWTHGTHVMDLAAGRCNRLSDVEADAASHAGISFVSLPRSAAIDGSGGSLAVHILDGIRHILRVSPAKVPVVINLSYGTLAGPHDGSSLLEVAMDELLSAHPEVQIVIGAGNGCAAQAHAVCELRARSGANTLRWLVQPGHPNDSFMELWFPHQPDDAVGKLAFRVRAPGAACSEWVTVDHQSLLRDANGAVVGCVVHQGHVPNGEKTNSMALIALAPTSSADGQRSCLAPSGVWEIELQNEGAAPVSVHAWIERDDTPYAPGTPQSRFFGEGVSTALGTLNSFATGNETIVVGACRVEGDALPNYSAAGPTRGDPPRPRPDLVAPGEQSKALPGLRGAAVRSGLSFRMGGTSAAAPVIARETFNLSVGGSRAPGSLTRQSLINALVGDATDADTSMRQFPNPTPPGDDAQRIGKGHFRPGRKAADSPYAPATTASARLEATPTLET